MLFGWISASRVSFIQPRENRLRPFLIRTERKK